VAAEGGRLMMTNRDALQLLYRTTKYNLKIIFASRFIYFMVAAVLFYFLITVINLFSPDANSTEADVYYLLILPGILLIFYPTAFGIQNDVDSHMLETLFGIPNYRYKVYLVRLAIIYCAVYVLLVGLSLISAVALAPLSVFDMAFQLMFPVFFLGCLTFMFSTIVKNGNGTAVTMVVIGMILWITTGFLETSKWNIFLNPFNLPDNFSEVVWATVILKNRLILATGMLLFVLYGLLNLQKREKFM
jgi:hypothetical protein